MGDSKSQQNQLKSNTDGLTVSEVFENFAAVRPRPYVKSAGTVMSEEARKQNTPDTSQVGSAAAATVTTISDSELIASARNGDARAFAGLVNRYEKKVARTVIAMLGNSAEADDVGQETFIRFYRSLDSFREESALGTYLTRIAINLSLNELKRRKRRGLFFGSTDNEVAIAMQSDNTDLGSQLANQDLIQWALAKLSPNLRAIITLRLIEGYSTAETAETLNIPQGTALSRLARAQKKLQKILSPHM